MIRSLLWIALGLLAISSGVPQGREPPQVEGDINEYMCKEFNVSCSSGVPQGREPPQVEAEPPQVEAEPPQVEAEPPQDEGDINEYMCKEHNMYCNIETTFKPVLSTPVPPTADEEDCQCVPVSRCSGEHGEGQIDLREKDPRCESYLEKCCKKENIKSSTLTMLPRPSEQCGKRNHQGMLYRIIGATNHETQHAEFPWMVAVLRQDNTSSGTEDNVYYCGGSLIHPQVVLTAAHRVQEPTIQRQHLTVRVGEWDFLTTKEGYPSQDLKVRQVIVHEQFDRETAHNDVALLILERPVDMSLPNVGTICLPEANENMDNRNCVANGWGKDSFDNKAKYQAILKKIDLSMVARSRCQEALRKTEALGSDFNLHESFVCAGGVSGKDTCEGDGGGPLACPSKSNPGVYVQAGVTAWGVGCGTEYPAVYAKVSHFVSWIHDKLKSQGISLHS